MIEYFQHGVCVIISIVSYFSLLIRFLAKTSPNGFRVTKLFVVSWIHANYPIIFVLKNVIKMMKIQKNAYFSHTLDKYIF